MVEQYNDMVYEVERLCRLLHTHNLSEHNISEINQLISGHIKVFESAMEQHVKVSSIID